MNQKRLDDGTTFMLRPIECEDAERLGRMFERLSPRTIYLRFFSPVAPPSDPNLRHLANVDHDHREALVAETDNEIVGVARYDRDAADADHAEVAIVVEDAWQGRGLGKVLLAELANDAHQRGVTTFTAHVLGENERMLALAHSLVPTTRIHLDHGEWLLDIPLASAAGATIPSDRT